ncbi:MAG: guanylate kinase, partial [Bacteroidales bacterium]|nr:guanylate kinase [Bacteroidales bacterium]
MEKGKIIIFSAPSGSGKTTLVKWLLGQNLNLYFSISATSRQPRSTETNGKDYYFLSPEAFRQKIAEDAFLEWEEVYPDKFYGTLKSEVERIISEGKHVLFDVDVKGGLNIKKHFGAQALSIFVQPPGIEVLRQ